MAAVEVPMEVEAPVAPPAIESEPESAEMEPEFVGEVTEEVAAPAAPEPVEEAPVATEKLVGEPPMDDSQIEQLLSEKLIAGYVLMEATCPKCAVPLVKSHNSVPKTLGSSSFDGDDKKVVVDQVVLVPSGSFEQPFKPVNGVPMCVACDSHVITQQTELAILEECDSLKDKGSIYVALDAMTEPSTATQIMPEIEEEKKEEEPAPQVVVDSKGEEKEVIKLDDITEDDVVVGNHRQKFLVDIKPTSFDMEGTSHVEMALSPKMGDPDKPIVVEEPTKEDVEEEEYCMRREIATKVLGAKMLQGWTLKEKMCADCAMPLMEFKGKEECPVCPALAKKAKKKLKQEKKLGTEKERLANAIQMKKDLEKEAGRIHNVREEVEVRALKEDDDATQLAEERKLAIKEEKARILAIQKQSDETPQEAEASGTQERARVSIEEEKMELERLEAIAKEEEARRSLMAEASVKESELATKEAEIKAEQESKAKELAEQKEAIAAMDEDDKTVAVQKDLMVQEHRKQLEEKVVLDDQVAQLEKERLDEAMDARRVAEEKRHESESRMIAALEADAAMKALAAEEAIKRAKAALQEVSDTKQQIILQTIEQAEKEAVAEAEESIKGRFEDHVEPVILQTNSEIHNERWETLRAESRAILTRRVMHGWTITPEACVGVECYNSPLLEKNGKKECVVCGGCGNGKDGAYLVLDEEEEAALAAEMKPAAPSVAAKTAPAPGEDWLGRGQEEKFAKMREHYAKEIGKKMLKGWLLTDASCPSCVMPMMMDDKGNKDICIVDGCEGPPKFDASTIATRDMADLESVKSSKPVVKSSPSDESLASTIQKKVTTKKQTKKMEPKADPPAFKPVVQTRVIASAIPEDIVHLPENVDFADAAAISQLVGGDDQSLKSAISAKSAKSVKDTSVETVANLFLKSPHGYDFQDFGKSMSVDEIKELVEIFLVTNVDKDVSDSFKYDVAKHIQTKMAVAKGREVASPKRRMVSSPRRRSLVADRFIFDNDDYSMTREPPAPEHIKPKARVPRSPGQYRSPVTSPRMRSPRDDMSVTSRASTVASEALDTIYDRIEICKEKLLDPKNSLDEQIATAALLEKLAQAAVAMKKVEELEE